MEIALPGSGLLLDILDKINDSTYVYSMIEFSLGKSSRF
jgi:hypothetical protein